MFRESAAPWSAGSPGDRMCSLHTGAVPGPHCGADVTSGDLERLSDRCASTVSSTTCQLRRRTFPIAAAARRAVDLPAVKAVYSLNGPVAQEGVEAVTTVHICTG